MMPDIMERYLVEIILLGGFFLAGSFARIITDSVIDATAKERDQSFTAIRSIFRLLFAGLIALSLLLCKTILPLV